MVKRQRRPRQNRKAGNIGEIVCFNDHNSPRIELLHGGDHIAFAIDLDDVRNPQDAWDRVGESVALDVSLSAFVLPTRGEALVLSKAPLVMVVSGEASKVAIDVKETEDIGILADNR